MILTGGKLKYWWSKLSNSEVSTGCVDVPRIPEFYTRQERVEPVVDDLL